MLQTTGRKLLSEKIHFKDNSIVAGLEADWNPFGISDAPELGGTFTKLYVPDPRRCSLPDER